MDQTTITVIAVVVALGLIYGIRALYGRHSAKAGADLRAFLQAQGGFAVGPVFNAGKKAVAIEASGARLATLTRGQKPALHDRAALTAWTAARSRGFGNTQMFELDFHLAGAAQPFRINYTSQGALDKAAAAVRALYPELEGRANRRGGTTGGDGDSGDGPD